MKERIFHRVNGSLAIYFGLGSLVGVLIGLGGLGMMIYKAIVSGTIIWWAAAFFLVMVVVFGLIAYSLLRVGWEEFDK